MDADDGSITRHGKVERVVESKCQREWPAVRRSKPEHRLDGKVSRASAPLRQCSRVWRRGLLCAHEVNLMDGWMLGDDGRISDGEDP